MDLPQNGASLADPGDEESLPVMQAGADAYPAPSIQADLFPSADAKQDIETRLTRILGAARERVGLGPVRSSAPRGELEAELSAFDFSSPGALNGIIDWVVARMTDGTVHTAHPRYFGLFNPTPNFPAICADRIAAAFNPQLASATTSPFPVLLEAHVIDAFARRLGLPVPSGGHFTSGGSEANATALLCALTRRDIAYAQIGVRTFSGAPRLYVSQDAHLAWLKIAHQLGIGRGAVRLVPTDGTGRMDPRALAAMIVDDSAKGDIPVMIASTAGTTNAGMVDPIRACTLIARDHQIWHHVDAAWGGAAIASDRSRQALDGIEAADSITIDPHKWLATTMGCGMFLTAHPENLPNAFGVVMDCMPSHKTGVDPYITSMQWSRRFLGLRLFLGLAAAGWDGFAHHIERAISLSGEVERRLIATGWKKRNQSALAVLCLKPPRGSAESRVIAERIVRDGAAWVSPVEFEGETLIRVCITSGETTIQDIAILCDRLNAFAAP